jgi:hypothetical protein
MVERVEMLWQKKGHIENAKIGLTPPWNLTGRVIILMSSMMRCTDILWGKLNLEWKWKYEND